MNHSLQSLYTTHVSLTTTHQDAFLYTLPHHISTTHTNQIIKSYKFKSSY